MQKILLEATEKGLVIPSEYNRMRIKQMVKDGTKLFELTPRVRSSRKQQGFLEAAVIPAWGHFQYGLDPRKPENAELSRTLFKQDWNSTVIKDKDGKPRRVAQSLSGKHAMVLNKYTDEAEQNGFPIPNNELYLTWRDEYSMEPKWGNYYDWLDALGLDVDSMPSKEVFSNLN